MKSWITTLAVAALALTGATTRADAQPYRSYQPASQIYISGYRACGTPIYAERYIAGYTRHGKPKWKTRLVAAPAYARPLPRPRYGYAPACPPPRPAYGGCRTSGGIVIQGSFRL